MPEVPPAETFSHAFELELPEVAWPLPADVDDDVPADDDVPSVRLRRYFLRFAWITEEFT